MNLLQKVLITFLFLIPSIIHADTTPRECSDSNSVYDQTKTKIAFWDKSEQSFFIKDLIANDYKKVTGLELTPEFAQSELLFYGPENRLLIVMMHGPHYAVVDSKTGQVISQYSQVANAVRNNGINPTTVVSPNGNVITSVFDLFFSMSAGVSIFDISKTDKPQVYGLSHPRAATSSDDGKTLYVIDRDSKLSAYDAQTKKTIFEKSYAFDRNAQVHWVGSNLRIGCKLFDKDGNELTPKGQRCDDYDHLDYTDDNSLYADGSYEDAGNKKPTVVIFKTGTQDHKKLDNSNWDGQDPVAAEFSRDGKNILINLRDPSSKTYHSVIHDTNTGAMITSVVCPQK